MRRPRAGARSRTPSPASVVRVDDAERLAANVLPRPVWDFVSGGAFGGGTPRANREALDRVRLIPRVLVDVSRRSTAANLLGASARLPIAIAPMAYQRLVHPEGELAAARAAKATGIPFTASMLSSFPLEDIAAAGGVSWLQVYWLRDRDHLLTLVRRAERAGYGALVATVDTPILGPRPADRRNGFTLPQHVVAMNLDDGSRSPAHRRAAGTSSLENHTRDTFDPSVTWRNVEWLREMTRLPLVLKGVLAAADADRAVRIGVDSIIVSNHGGRQLDGVVASADALPEVCAAVAGRCPVFFDSGIRDGIDVLRALALGAAGVFVGRPALWGLAIGGSAGVGRIVELLGEELGEAMALTGCGDLAAVRRLRSVSAARRGDIRLNGLAPGRRVLEEADVPDEVDKEIRR